MNQSDLTENLKKVGTEVLLKEYGEECVWVGGYRRRLTEVDDECLLLEQKPSIVWVPSV